MKSLLYLICSKGSIFIVFKRIKIKMTKIITVIISIFFITSSFLSFAQNAEGEIDLLVKKTESVYSSKDSLGNYVYIFSTAKQYQVTFFNKQHVQAANYVVSIPPQVSRDDYLGTQLLGDSCMVYYFNDHSRMITQLSINKNSGQLSKKIIGQLAYSAKFLKSFPLNNNFYVLTTTHGKNEIEVHTISEGTLTKMTYPVEMPDLYKRLSSENGLLNEEPSLTVGIDRINYKIENNVKSARATKKAYTYNNGIYLAFDDADYTHIIHIDLIQSTCTYKQFLFSQNKSGHSLKKQGNSFLLDDKLFRVTLSPDQLTFTVLDIKSNDTYTTFYATPQNTISFKNGPIIQENSADKQKVLEDQATFFKKVLASNLSIAVNVKDSVYIVEIGSYEEYVSSGGNGMSSGSGPAFSMSMGMGMGMGMGGMGMGMGGMGMGMGGSGMGMGYDPYGYRYPGYYNGYSGYYPYNSTTTTIRTLYFHSMIDTTSFKQEPGIVPISLRERVSNFETTMFKEKPPELIRIVDFEDKIIIGYLIASSNTFKMYSFYK